MTYLDPVFPCGECRTPIARWPVENLLHQRVLDWRHISPPSGMAPHRAILGTPGPAVRTAPPVREESGPEIRRAPAPEIPARPAMRDELPTSAARMDKLADEHGWLVEAWFMRGTLMDAFWRPGRVRSSVVLRMARGGVGLAAVWAEDIEGKWPFEDGYAFAAGLAAVGSPTLRKLITSPDMDCASCGEHPARHDWTDGGLVCHSVRDTNGDESPDKEA